jgi:nitrogen fixation protein
MDGAHGVQMGILGAALKNHMPQTGLDDPKILVRTDGGWWGAALQHACDGF